MQALGAEIEGEPGLGYVLKPGFLLPPLMFSAAEIEALALGAQWVARRTDEGLSQAARNAMAKIAAVLPPIHAAKPGGRRADRWPRLGAAPGRAAELPAAGAPRGAQACHRLLRRERRRGRRASSGRPHSASSKSTRILAAWCELRGGFRHFRADRIDRAELLSARLPKGRKALAKEWRKTLLTESGSEPAL